MADEDEHIPTMLDQLVAYVMNLVAVLHAGAINLTAQPHRPTVARDEPPPPQPEVSSLQQMEESERNLKQQQIDEAARVALQHAREEKEAEEALQQQLQRERERELQLQRENEEREQQIQREHEEQQLLLQQQHQQSQPEPEPELSIPAAATEAIAQSIASQITAAIPLFAASVASLFSSTATTLGDSYALLDSNSSDLTEAALASLSSNAQEQHPLRTLYHAALHIIQQQSAAAQLWYSQLELQRDECVIVTVLIGVLLYMLLYSLYYFKSAAVRPTLITQHASAGPHAVATQRPPVRIDTSSLPALQAVVYAVSPSSRLGKLLSQHYLPTPWLSLPILSGHLQTVLTAKATPHFLQTPFVTYKREILPVAAGSEHTLPGQVALDWAVLGKARKRSATPIEWQSAFTDTTPTVIVCHGLAGGSSEHYVKNTIFKLSQAPHNFRCVVFNARGCGGSELLSPQLYCGAYTDDLRQVVANLRSRLPRSPLLAVGFSLGANILTKFLGEEGLAGRAAPFAAAVAVANPFDFLHGARHLDSNIVQRNLYSRTLAGNLIRLFKTHMHVLDRDGSKQKGLSSPKKVAPEGQILASSPEFHRNEQWDLSEVFSAPTLREFDKRLTRIVFGYATVDDYYRDASSSRFVKFINTPTLFLNALDDPISSPTAIPVDECSINPFVTLVTTPTGGHSMDHFSGVWNLHSWTAKAIAAFFTDVTSVHGAVGNQARASPMITPPPPAVQQADGFESIDGQLVDSPPVWVDAPFTPSAPYWGRFVEQSSSEGTDEEDVATSMQAALDLQQRLAELERILEESQAEDDEN